ncbi:MAG: orotidine-5'-phosphate decarboxylase [Acidimicrobiia bacterium]
MTEAAPDEVRAHLAIALDVDDEVVALRLAREVRPWFGVAKVGMELYYAAGPSIVEALIDLDFDVFADLKLYDIPTTVRKAAQVVGSLGARYLNSPAAAGEATVGAMVEGFLAGAAAAGTADPIPLAVTVLTSEATADEAVLRARVELAVATGCHGVVCAASDLAVVQDVDSGLVTVVPGIRPAGAPTHDQGRVATPRAAVEAGAGVLVVGRAVTEAGDVAAAASAVAAELGSSPP